MELMYWWLLPVAAAAAAGAGWLVFRRGARGNARRRPVANADRLTSLPEYQAAVRRYRRWLGVAALAAVTLLTSAAIAAARPVDLATIRPEQHNRDIVLCLDASGSMSGADAAVVEAFARLAKGFDGERLGLTVFDSSAVQVFPLTDDYEYVREQLQVAKDAFDGAPGSAGFLDGTWNGAGSSLIGDGLASCVQGFPVTDPGAGPGARTEQRSRSVILATDNFISGDPIFTLEEAAALATKKEVRVFALNPGDLDYGTAPDQPGAQLRRAAEGTGGLYYGPDSPEAVPDIIRKIQSTEATTFRAAPQAAVADRAEIPLAIAVVSGLVLAGASRRLRS